MEENLKIEYLELAQLKPYDKNSRTHSKEQIDEIIRSIKTYGYCNPISINTDNIIVCGHGRLEAAKAMGLKKLPCIRYKQFDVHTLRAGYTIADNKIALHADWDYEKLKEEFLVLEANAFDPTLTGFGREEIDEILHPEIDVYDEEEDFPQEPSPDPISALGDLWILGQHRLLCGDSTNPDNYKRLTNDDTIIPVLMVTDPPYGVKYDPSWRDGADLGVGERSRGKVLNDDRADWLDTYALFTGNVAYVWHAGRFTHVVAKNLEDCGFDLISQIIWAKQHFALSRGDYHWQHEPCWYAVRKGHNHQWCGKRDQATLWEIKNNNKFGNANAEETVGHGTQKPLETMLRPIQNNSKPNDYIYDPFGGSGTTLIASQKSGRKCLMMELDPAYVDMIIKRWQKETGFDAVLDGTNQTYNSLLT